MDSSEKTVASRIADVVVWLISLLILFGGFLAWRVYQANPARNDYDLAVGIFNDVVRDIDELHTLTDPLMSYCDERGENEELCGELRSAYDASVFDSPKELSRITSASTYEKETTRVNQNTEQARNAVEKLRELIPQMTEAVEVALEEAVGPQRTQMRDSVQVALNEIATGQEIVDASQGRVDDSVRTQAQEAINALQALVDQAGEMMSWNPDDYTNMNENIRQGIDAVSNGTVNITVRLG